MEQLEQTIKDAEVRVPAPKEVADIPLSAVMPWGEKVARNGNMPANLPTDKKIVEFVLMKDDLTANSAGQVKGLNLPLAELFDVIVA